MDAPCAYETQAERALLLELFAFKAAELLSLLAEALECLMDDSAEGRYTKARGALKAYRQALKA